MNPQGATASEIAEAVRKGRINAIEVAEAFLDRIDALDRTIGAFLSVDRMGALAAARTVDRKVSTGEDPGKLAGVPVAVKDNLCTAGQPTTAGSRILAGFVPPYDAHVVERLRAEGAVILGKTNLDEFAMGSSCENSALGRTVNPHDPKRVPGGSSGGSAAAVAAGLVPVALGSDTGGSIRQPAALCGIVGMKPTYGRVSRFGLIAFGSSLDQVGPLARTAEDAALLLEAVAGHDPRDSTSAERRVEEYRAAARRGVRGLRIGVPKEYFPEGLDVEVASSVRAAIAKIEALGARAVEVEMPHTRYAIPTYYIVATAEASSNLARYDGVHYGCRAPGPRDLYDLYARSRTEGFGQEVKRRIMLGTFILSSGYSDQYYVKALRVRRLIKEDFDRAFEKVDVVAGPTSPLVAFEFGARAADPLQMYLCDVLTVAANLAGLPGISIPCGTSAGGLPIGLQFQGPSFGEATLFSLAGAFQAATDHHARRPEAFP